MYVRYEQIVNLGINMNHVSHLHKHEKLHAWNNFLQLNSDLEKLGFLCEHHAVSIHFIHSIGMCRMRRFLAVLRSFFYSSLLYPLSFHPFPTTSLPSSLTSSCHLFLGLPFSLFASKFIYNTFSGIPFSSNLCTCAKRHNLFNLIASVIVGFLTA